MNLVQVRNVRFQMMAKIRVTNKKNKCCACGSNNFTYCCRVRDSKFSEHLVCLECPNIINITLAIRDHTLDLIRSPFKALAIELSDKGKGRSV